MCRKKRGGVKTERQSLERKVHRKKDVDQKGRWCEYNVRWCIVRKMVYRKEDDMLRKEDG